MLKGENITRDGDIREVDEPSFISDEVHARFPRTQLEKDDLIVSVRGEVGKVGLVTERYAGANINANTIRIALNNSAKGLEFEPTFIWDYLNSPLGQLLIRQFIAGGVQETITAPELLQVRIPKLRIDWQRDLVAAMDAARVERHKKLAEADVLLVGLDAFLLDALGLTPPPKDSRRVFAIRRITVQQRFDPHFHAPEFARLQKMLGQTSCEPLGVFSCFSNETWKPEDHDQPTFRYIEISTVNPKTGEASWNELPTKEAPSRARMRVRADDIIVSLTRPHHGSITTPFS